MNKLTKLIRVGLVLGLLLASVSMTFAQTQTVNGRVFDESGQPVIGATVVIKGTSMGTVSDANGNFSVTASPKDVITISYLGFSTEEIAVGNKTSFDVTLKDVVTQMKDVVVVGYGTQRKANLTGAVSTVDVDKSLVAKPFTDIAKGLQGVVPGLQITYGNGDISTTPSIQIRGLNSVNGSSTPLILVDGVVVSDITLVNPNDIAGISVLKDAASTSIFGARAAAGVIMITTKSGGRNTKFSVNYSNNFSWSNRTVLPQFPDPVQEIQTEVLALQRTGGTYDMFGAKADALIDGINNWKAKYAGKESGNNMVMGQDFEIINGSANFYRVWDPLKIMYQTMPAQNHNINFSGGTDKLSYYMSGSYSYNEGIMKVNPNKLNKWNMMVGITADMTNWLTMEAKISDRQFNYDYPYVYQDYAFYMWRWGANQPYGTYTDPSTGQSYYFRNPNGLMAGANTNTYRSNTPNINLAATLKFSPRLNLRSEFSYMYTGGLRHETGGLFSVWDQWSTNLPLTSPQGASYDETDFTSSFTTQITSNTYLTYNQKFGIHNLKVMAGLNAEKGEFQQTYAKGFGLMDPSKGEVALLSNSQPPVIFTTSTAPLYQYGPYHTWWSVAGYFGRINYDYNNKYLLEVNGRYDGSSNFPTSGRWAFFPSVSAGWRITEESFMKNTKPAISDWKIRASYGTIGNQDVGANLFVPVMTTAQTNWITGSARTTYTGMPQVVPSSLTWERINTLDIGTDLRLLDNNLGLTFDWYQRDNVGMVAPSATLPSVFGANVAKTNMGNMRTNGWELGLDYHHGFSNGLQLYGNVALSNYVAKITKWTGNDANSLNTAMFYTGETVGEIWGFKTVGYFKDAQDVANSPSQSALQASGFQFSPGDIKYADLNNDGKIDGGSMTLDDHGDLMKIGNTTPKYQYSFRLGAGWKGFDADVFFQGVGKRDMWATGNLAIPQWSGNGIFLDNQLDYWTPTNTNAKWPNPFMGSSVSNIPGQNYWVGQSMVTNYQPSGNNFYPQTKYLLSLAYLRLKTFTIGYSLPALLTQKVGIDKLRIYVEGANLLTFSSNQIPVDPEITTGSSTNNWYGATVPFNKTYSFGLQLTF